MRNHFRTYEVIGRGAPKDGKEGQLYRMKLFAPNEVVAKSRFWYFLSQLKKVKKATGEIVSVIEIHERKPHTIKNFGIFLRYDSRSGTHNMYKEFRDTTLNGAISQLYLDMAGRHRARTRNIQIIKTTRLVSSKCKRPSTTTFHNDKLKFPIPHHAAKPTSKRFRRLYSASRPATHVQ